MGTHSVMEEARNLSLIGSRVL